MHARRMDSSHPTARPLMNEHDWPNMCDYVLPLFTHMLARAYRGGRLRLTDCDRRRPVRSARGLLPVTNAGL